MFFVLHFLNKLYTFSLIDFLGIYFRPHFQNFPENFLRHVKTKPSIVLYQLSFIHVCKKTPPRPRVKEFTIRCVEFMPWRCLSLDRRNVRVWIFWGSNCNNGTLCPPTTKKRKVTTCVFDIFARRQTLLYHLQIWSD